MGTEKQKDMYMGHNTKESNRVARQELLEGLQKHVIQECEDTGRYPIAMMEFASAILSYLEHYTRRTPYERGYNRMDKFFMNRVVPTVAWYAEDEKLFIIAKLYEWSSLSIIRHTTAAFVSSELERAG